MLGQWRALGTIGSCQQSMFTKAWINLDGFTITFVPPMLASPSSDTPAVEFLASRPRGPDLPSFDGFETPCGPQTVLFSQAMLSQQDRRAQHRPLLDLL
jgi:hypothetical protein